VTAVVGNINVRIGKMEKANWVTHTLKETVWRLKSCPLVR
jgi:hypothetical protein